ncbi:mannosyltransferase family protein [Allocoleopsis franciscana]|uniref:Putative integral membrane protein n=1 Tax=Allocoleopsis franciscana PCC 7113 TaxID=1173027 RepID=K9WEQ1_9CYAN|nr:mannosyltransferase family protein [Allocoleopsis franciscana]AFZ18678.1 putative integral membrane protein [Allocoleopsis franciscana PCC 7113]
MKTIEPGETDGFKVRLKTQTWAEGLIFVIAIWLLSRLVIFVAMQLLAPVSPISPVTHSGTLPLDYTPDFVPQTSWNLFAHWDGAWYRKIATLGYDYAQDGKYHSIAFFPLFPLAIRAVMSLGLPSQIAGTLVNNLALLGALWLLYRWAEERYSVSVARWATAVLAWCPFSLYGTVVYSEGLFLLVTTAALRSFDQGQYTKAALWGTLATATRSTGVALIPAFLIVAWQEKRPKIAYIAGLAAMGGLLLFSLYCAIDFADPLAFVHVQQAWKSQHPNWFRVLINALKLDEENLLRVVTFWGGGYLLWYLRAKLPPVAVAYGFCSLGIILATGSLSSVSRYVYGIVSIALALGWLFASHPRWGYLTLGLFAVILVRFALRFAWWYWVA